VCYVLKHQGSGAFTPVELNPAEIEMGFCVTWMLYEFLSELILAICEVASVDSNKLSLFKTEFKK
jgi:hypothetical protein